MKQKQCPFKYKDNKCIDMEEVTYREYDACKLMSPIGDKQNECVGEKICPIMRRKN